MMRLGVSSPELLAQELNIERDSLERVCRVYPIFINRYFLERIKESGASLFKQVVPDPRELIDQNGIDDPLSESNYSPVRCIVHRYEDRALFLVSTTCAVFCRFCTRKRMIGRARQIRDEELKEGIDYIKSHKEIKDVLISGGDPLVLSNERLEWIIARVREIHHVDIIRIGTRVVSVLPQRIEISLIEMLKKYHPIYINVHFNHPDEINHEVEEACGLLCDAGIPVGNQTVLLKGINDDPHIIATLMRRLLKMRVRPYYLHQADLTKGTEHFRTSIETGLRIIEFMTGRVSGMAIPSYVVDLPGGGGKVPVVPDYLVKKSDKRVVFRNFEGRLYTYYQ